MTSTPPSRPRAGFWPPTFRDRKSTRLNSSHLGISYAVFCLKKKNASGLTRSVIDLSNYLSDIVPIGAVIVEFDVLFTQTVRTDFVMSRRQPPAAVPPLWGS